MKTNRFGLLRLLATAWFLLTAVAGFPGTGSAQGKKSVSSKVRGAQQAIAAYLALPAAEAKPGAQAKKLQAALRKAVKKCGNLKTATAALRSLPPLTKAKPGSTHGLKFTSGESRSNTLFACPRAMTTNVGFRSLSCRITDWLLRKMG